MRADHHSRQSRRAALCIGAPHQRSHRRPRSLRRLWLTAYGVDLSLIAERVELELSAELAELLSPTWLPKSASVGSRRGSSTDGQNLDIAAQA